MAKKKKMTFSKMLKENQKVINVMTNDGEKISLSDITEKAIEDLTASPLSGIIPVSSAEAVENAVPGSTHLSISTSYAQNVFSMYEFALKYNGTKQTLVIGVPEEEVEDILDANYHKYGPLNERTNLKLILDKFPDKLRKRLINWTEEEETPAMFVIRIPNIVIFHGDIKKHDVTKAKFFDLVIEVLRSGKSLTKLKKKRPKEFSETSKFFATNTVHVLKEFGVSCAHIPLDPEFYNDPHEYASIWCSELANDSNKILTRVVFCTPDPDDLVSFNTQIAEDLFEKVGVTMV